MRSWSFLGLVAFVLLTGCDGFYQSIPKNTVMVKKIPKSIDNQAEYPGTLSEETVKSLSLDAINKYMGQNLSLGDVIFNIIILNQNQVKEVMYQYMNPSKTYMDPLVQYKTELSQIPSGIYVVNVVNRYDKKEQYAISLNARDGDLLGSYQMGSAVFSKVSALSEENKDKILLAAETYIEQYGDVSLDSVELDTNQRYWQQTTLLSYQDKETKNLKYNVLIDVHTLKVIGYTKDIMSGFNILFGVTMKDSIGEVGE